MFLSIKFPNTSSILMSMSLKTHIYINTRTKSILFNKKTLEKVFVGYVSQKVPDYSHISQKAYTLHKHCIFDNSDANNLHVVI